jgi:hypothetical protein
MVSMLLNTIDDAKQNARGFFYRFNVAVDPPVQAGEARPNGSGRTAG